MSVDTFCFCKKADQGLRESKTPNETFFKRMNVELHESRIQSGGSVCNYCAKRSSLTGDSAGNSFGQRRVEQLGCGKKVKKTIHGSGDFLMYFQKIQLLVFLTLFRGGSVKSGEVREFTSLACFFAQEVEDYL